MANKTLIDGTSYEISNNKTLIEGTSYGIRYGKTLIDNTVYDVDILDFVTVTILSLNTNWAEVSVLPNYDVLDTGVYKLPVGTVLNCYIQNNDRDGNNSGIYINGTKIASAPTEGYVKYDYTLTKDVSIIVDQPAQGYQEGEIRIEEVSEEVKTVTVTVMDNAIDSHYCWSSVHYNLPNGEKLYLNTVGEYQLPIGTIIYCEIEIRDDQGYRPSVGVTLNNVIMDSSTTYCYYAHSLVKNTSIQHINHAYMGGEISITEET